MSEANQTPPPAAPKPRPTRRRGRGEGGVGRRPDGSWYATVSIGTDANGKRLRKYFYGASKSEVTKARAEYTAAHSAGFDPTNETVGVYLRAFLEELKATAKINTYANYEWALVRVSAKLGHVRLSELRSAHLDTFLAELRADQASAYTQNYCLTVFRRALRKALKQDRLPKDPFVGIERPKHQKRAQTVWTEAQVAAFLEANKDSKYYALYFLALRAGLREGELLGLQWHEVDFDAKTVRVDYTLVERNGTIYGRQPAKSAAGHRTVYLSDTAVGVLRAHKADLAATALRGQTALPQWVFPNRDGGPHRKSNFWVAWKAAVEHAGLPYIRPHDMRHTKGTIAVRSGVDPKILQEQLGHADLKMTLGTYYHPNEADHRAAVERMEAALESKEGKK
jgi:integrase